MKHPAYGELESKKSRFLAYLKPIESKDAAMQHLEDVRSKHPDAAHHCWAYIVGEPHNSGIMGMSDDREPHNTAGRPMLSVLQNRNIGNIAAVVVRYWGGTKLGTGGLVRAYSGAVQGALENAQVIEKIETSELMFQIEFSAEAAVRRKLESLPIIESEINYTNGVNFALTIPASEKEIIISTLCDTVNGKISFL
ncbi:MAG: YigZ family protein [Lentisphaerae bacterium]|nr:YigZ family protein [Lentisphaerota bacterium]MCP4101327.1 YigZ family protein [Lentisphaerota bacterium]